jgi:tetratricopeptide (TPR) repeat protein
VNMGAFHLPLLLGLDSGGVGGHPAANLGEPTPLDVMMSQVAGTYNNIGRLAAQMGRRDEARAMYTEALQIWREAYGPQHRLVGMAQGNLAGVR